MTEVLDETPACDGAMLTLLDCVAAATCKPHEEPCQAESRAMKDCASANRGGSSPPPAGGTDIDPGDPGSPGPTGTIACNLVGTRFPPGSPATTCTSEWSECADGRTYNVECDVRNGTDFTCTCIVDGSPGASFQKPGCGVSSTEAKAQCGWDLQ